MEMEIIKGMMVIKMTLGELVPSGKTVGETTGDGLAIPMDNVGEPDVIEKVRRS